MCTVGAIQVIWKIFTVQYFAANLFSLYAPNFTRIGRVLSEEDITNHFGLLFLGPLCSCESGVTFGHHQVNTEWVSERSRSSGGQYTVTVVHSAPCAVQTPPDRRPCNVIIAAIRYVTSAPSPTSSSWSYGSCVIVSRDGPCNLR